MSVSYNMEQFDKEVTFSYKRKDPKLIIPFFFHLLILSLFEIVFADKLMYLSFIVVRMTFFEIINKI